MVVMVTVNIAKMNDSIVDTHEMGFRFRVGQVTATTL